MIVIEPAVFARWDPHWYIYVNRDTDPASVQWERWARRREWLVFIVHTVYPNGDYESRVVRN